eukprot:gene10548-21990_t
MNGILPRNSAMGFLLNTIKYVNRLTKTTGKSFNVHKSNRAKKGLFHGADVMSGHTISHSGVRAKRKWYPNVLNKRVWSDALDTWVRFKMTARALKAIDDVGGIDNYLVDLHERDIKDSNYVIKMRGLVASALYHKGQLTEDQKRKMNYIKNPPQLIMMNSNNVDDTNGSAHL